MAVLGDLKMHRPGTLRASGGQGARGKHPCLRTGVGAGQGLFHGAALLIYLVAMVGNASPGHTQGTSEYEVKAAFLYNFAKFVEWPSPPQTAIELCVVGEDPFGKILEDTVQGKTINGQPMVVRRLKAREDPRNCQIAFVNAPEREARSILDVLRGAHTLTVGESPSFAQDGGIINFVLKDNRVQFEINIDAAEQARLRISSKLLSLAKIVRNGNRTGEP